MSAFAVCIFWYVDEEILKYAVWYVFCSITFTIQKEVFKSF